MFPKQRIRCEWKINREAKCSVSGPAKSALRHGSWQPESVWKKQSVEENGQSQIVNEYKSQLKSSPAYSQ
jgi:hypothetical protein